MYSVVTVYSVVTWSGSDPFLTCIMITKLSQVLYKKTYKTVQQYLMSHLISYFIFKKLKFVIFERFIKIVWPIDTVDPKLWKNWIRIHPKFLWKFRFHTKILKSYSLQFTEMNVCSIFNQVYTGVNSSLCFLWEGRQWRPLGTESVHQTPDHLGEKLKFLGWSL